jgi:septum formation topological specificity factor MinE
MSDRVALAPETFDLMKGEVLTVLQRYLEVDEHNIDVHFENAERRFMLYANVPVTNIKSSEQIELERQRYAVGGDGSPSAVGPPPRRRRRRRRNRSHTNGDRSVSQAPELTEPQAANGASGNGGTPPAHEPYSGAGNGAMASGESAQPPQ